jgi:hypothetical protein
MSCQFSKQQDILHHHRLRYLWAMLLEFSMELQCLDLQWEYMLWAI